MQCRITSSVSPQVSDPAEKVEGAVPHGDEGVLAEEDGLRPVGRLGELGKYDARHAGLYDHPHNALHRDDDQRHAAVLGGHPRPVTEIFLIPT